MSYNLYIYLAMAKHCKRSNDYKVEMREMRVQI